LPKHQLVKNLKFKAAKQINLKDVSTKLFNSNH